jgi:hypothetical protein
MFETEAVRENYELGVLAGEAREKERIIKLLDKDYWHSQVWNFAEVTCLADCEMCKTIALIKGEK